MEQGYLSGPCHLSATRRHPPCTCFLRDRLPQLVQALERYWYEIPRRTYSLSGSSHSLLGVGGFLGNATQLPCSKSSVSSCSSICVPGRHFVIVCLCVCDAPCSSLVHSVNVIATHLVSERIRAPRRLLSASVLCNCIVTLLHNCVRGPLRHASVVHPTETLSKRTNGYDCSPWTLAFEWN